MNERTDASAAFALRLSADLLTSLVLTETMSKRAATKLVDDSLATVLASHPDLAPALREIAAVLTSQVELVALDFQRMKDRET